MSLYFVIGRLAAIWIVTGGYTSPIEDMDEKLGVWVLTFAIGTTFAVLALIFLSILYWVAFGTIYDPT